MRIGQEGGGDRRFKPPALAFGIHRSELIAQCAAVIARGRKTVIARMVKRREQRRAPPRILGRGPKRRIIARAVEGRKDRIACHRLGHRLTEGQRLDRHGGLNAGEKRKREGGESPGSGREAAGARNHHGQSSSSKQY